MEQFEIVEYKITVCQHKKKPSLLINQNDQQVAMLENIPFSGQLAALHLKQKLLVISPIFNNY